MKQRKEIVKQRIIVIGLGNQSIDDHIPAILDSNELELVGVVDKDHSLAKTEGEKLGVPFDSETSKLIKELKSKPDIALVAVPHSSYLGIIQELAKKGVHVIKEKPFSTSVREASDLIRIADKYGISIQVTLQRRFNPIYTSFPQLIKRVGIVHSVEARYTMNIKKVDEGWRASSLFAGGGALIDLGYHYVDLLIWYFGLPEKILCKTSTGNREGQQYDVEDTAFVSLTKRDPSVSGRELIANLVVSRVYPEKNEELVAYGSKGSVLVQRGRILRKDTNGETQEMLTREVAWPSALVDQLEKFADNISKGLSGCNDEYLKHVAFIEACYESSRSGRSINPHKYYKQLKEVAN